MTKYMKIIILVLLLATLMLPGQSLPIQPNVAQAKGLSNGGAISSSSGAIEPSLAMVLAAINKNGNLGQAASKNPVRKTILDEGDNDSEDEESSDETADDSEKDVDLNQGEEQDEEDASTDDEESKSMGAAPVADDDSDTDSDNSSGGGSGGGGGGGGSGGGMPSMEDLTKMLTDLFGNFLGGHGNHNH